MNRWKWEQNFEKDTKISEGEQHEEKSFKTMHRVINSLGKVDKALVLLYLEDKKYEEIAEIMGMTTSNVGVRLLRAKKKLEMKVKESTQDI